MSGTVLRMVSPLILTERAPVMPGSKVTCRGAARPAVIRHPGCHNQTSPQQGEELISDYLPKAYTDFRSSYPGVAEALDGLGAASDEAGPLDGRTRHLVKLGIAIGALAEGAVRSHARQALAAGATPDEVRHTAVLAISTAGFPTAIAALGWIDEVLAAR